MTLPEHGAGKTVRCACGAALLLWAQAASAAPATHVVTDMRGNAVTVPETIERLAEQFPAHTITDIMLGMGDKLVAIPRNVKTIPLLQKVYPGITAVPETFRNGGTVNIEDLLSRRPDVVSMLGGTVSDTPFKTAGIPAVVMTFASLEQLPKSITLAGDVYGGDAKVKAAAFVAYFNGKLAAIQARLADLPDAQRPSVVHISSFPPLVIDGGTSLIDNWIKQAGGRDAAHDVSGVHVGITMEQLLTWDPDVLIVETPGGDQGLAAGSGQSVLKALSETAGWQQLRAVRTKRVFMNPQGLYPWDRYGPEEALQIQWAAKTLHPDKFADLDIRAEAKRFYQTFFGYALSDADLRQMFQE
ncbi:ABC transporter substrate-binding protein [Beijerinckia sp. L45]|uniref:ABC transporter substrate-binding protein n=1 Tax=Beijerinckia sp. L45 TaxID=1641855 RepID=UPI001AEE0BDB|nr:ABC transporter substrate-binding protein [Beijerinckia sp. L45]